MTDKELPEMFSGKSKRGRPHSKDLDILAEMCPDVSRRGLNSMRAATLAFSVIQANGSEEVKAYLTDDKTLKKTLLTALGRLVYPEPIMHAAEIITERRFNATQGKTLIRKMRQQQRGLDSFEAAVLRAVSEYRNELQFTEMCSCLHELADALEAGHQEGQW